MLQKAKLLENTNYTNFHIYKIKNIMNYEIMPMIKDDTSCSTTIQIQCIGDILPNLENNQVIMKYNDECQTSGYIKCSIGPLDSIVCIQESVNINDIIENGYCVVEIKKMIFNNMTNTVHCISEFQRNIN